MRKLFFGVVLLCVFSVVMCFMFWGEKEKEKKIKWPTKAEKVASSEGIAITREYQIKVDVGKFENRKRGIHEYINLISSAFNIPISEEKSKIVIREISMYDPVPCGSRKRQIRKRFHFDPFSEGNAKLSNYTTLDIKHSTSSSFDEIYELPFAPRLNYTSQSFQKLEYDVHPCRTKYSRESRITFEQTESSFLELKTCKDILTFFPNVILTEAEQNKEMKKLVDRQYWWLMEQTFFVSSSTKLQATFNLSYRNYTEAYNGNVIPQDKSEFSLRLWAPQHGFAPWDDQIVQHYNEAYQQLVRRLQLSCND